MEWNVLTYYGFLTREEYEAHCFEIVPEQDGWTVRSMGCRNRYPKSLTEAKEELRKRGLDPGDEEYGLARVMESGAVRPAGKRWKKIDIDLAVIELAELDCIAPWVHACRSFNVKPVEYVKAFRAVVEENLERLGPLAADPLFYRYEFGFGDDHSAPGTLAITLRDDWKRLSGNAENPSKNIPTPENAPRRDQIA